MYIVFNGNYLSPLRNYNNQCVCKRRPHPVIIKQQTGMEKNHYSLNLIILKLLRRQEPRYGVPFSFSCGKMYKKSFHLNIRLFVFFSCLDVLTISQEVLTCFLQYWLLLSLSLLLLVVVVVVVVVVLDILFIFNQFSAYFCNIGYFLNIIVFIKNNNNKINNNYYYY